ncbi:hypothetical protein SEA_RIZWANA_90 [Arthrobacter phage Rizwana]|nr:hypothetical protein SEA_RIZWANA_90 [Arthrobacter phage Rizwana]
MMYMLRIWTHTGRISILREELEAGRQQDLAKYPANFHPIVNRIWDEAAEKHADAIRPGKILARMFGFK